MPNKIYKVLLVEDSPDRLREMYELLTQNGYLVDTAVTGKDAIEKAQRVKYDILIMGLLVPDMSGLELLTLMEKKKCRCMKVMVWSNMYNYYVAEDLIEKGVDSYTSKFDTSDEELLEEITRVLEGNGSIMQQMEILKKKTVVA